MGTTTGLSIISLILLIVGQLFTVVALATNYWSEIGSTYGDSVYKGLWQQCSGSKIVSGKSRLSNCRGVGTENVIVQITECLALIFGFFAVCLWMAYMCKKKKTKRQTNNFKYSTIVLASITAFLHIISAIAWGFLEGNISWSFGLAILASVLFILALIFVSVSKPEDKEKRDSRYMRTSSLQMYGSKTPSMYSSQSQRSSVYSIGQHSNQGYHA